MKPRIVGVLLPVVVACAGAAPEPQVASDDADAQTATDEPSADDTNGDKAKPGGYMEVATDREDIVETAEHAVGLLKTRTGDDSLALQSIERSETQVVAGRNTRLTMVLTGSNGEQTVTVVVHRNLQGEESLSSVEGL